MIVTAADLKLPQLYRYQPFKGKEERLHEVFVDKKLRFSDPRFFNDPWDCRYHYSDRRLHEPEYQKQLFTRLWILYEKHYGGTLPAGFVKRYQENPHEALQWWLEGFNNTGSSQGVGPAYRVCCFSEAGDVPLMWAHYADSHRGVCLEFQTDSAVMGSAFKVQYCQRFPEVDFLDDSDSANLAFLVCKSQDWSYEREFRLVAQDDGPHRTQHQTLISQGGFVPIPDEALSAVILGCQMDEACRQAVIEIVKDLNPKLKMNVRIREAVRIRDSYKLTIKDL